MIKTKKSDLNNYHEDDDYGSGNYDYHEETFGHKHHFLDGMRKSLGIHKHYRSTAEGRKGNIVAQKSNGVILDFGLCL